MEKWIVLCVDMKARMRIREENKTYEGVRWLLQAPTFDPQQFLGFAWRDQFVSNERLARLGVSPRPGDHITLYFDRSGAICNVEVVTPPAA